jgi:hypothetical protein
MIYIYSIIYIIHIIIYIYAYIITNYLQKKPKGKDGKPQCHLMTSWGYVMGAPLMATKGSMKRCL